MTSQQAAITSAIIIPAFKHSALVAETIVSALTQRTTFRHAVVVVNDGCPMVETDLVCREFAHANPDFLFYIRQDNKGLSGARNTGAEFCLQSFPTIRSIQFLDADDLMSPTMLQRLVTALDSSSPDVGWAYTDQNNFGFEGFNDLSGGYNPAEHLFRNITPASSLVSRRMFDAGLRFDESMKSGMEDWDFWLQGLASGFRGVHVPGGSLRYRVRGESMVRDTIRNAENIHSYLHAKHSKLFSAKAMAESEAAFLPRFALINPQVDRVRYLTHSSDDVKSIDTDTFINRLLRAPYYPEPGAVPPFLFFVDQATEALLKEWGLLETVLWNLQRAASNHKAALLNIEWSADNTIFADFRLDNTPANTPANAWPQSVPDAFAVMVSTPTLLRMTPLAPTSRDPQTERSLRSPILPWLNIGLPAERIHTNPGDASVGAAVGDLLSAISDKWFLECELRSVAIRDGRAWPIRPELLYANVHDVPAVLPLPRGVGKRCAIVLAGISGLHESELIQDLVVSQRGAGYVVHFLAMARTRAVVEQSRFMSKIPTVLIPLKLSPSDADGAAQSTYMGVRFRRTANDNEPNENLGNRSQNLSFTFGSLVAFDRVLFLGTEALFLAGRLRDAGVETLMLARSECGPGISGHYSEAIDVPGILAYEHALDRILVIDADVAAVLHGLGIPASKLCTDWRDHSCPT
jgi:glycosyltransferase involved in cell wall biosynthesis